MSRLNLALETTPGPELALVPEIRKAENASDSIPATPAAPSHDEPVVTRRELWSYYRVYRHCVFSHFAILRR